MYQVLASLGFDAFQTMMIERASMRPILSEDEDLPPESTRPTEKSDLGPQVSKS